MKKTANTITIEELNRRSKGHLPGLVGMEVVALDATSITMRLAVRPELLAPNGFLHAATVVALADTACGYGTMATLNESATARDGAGAPAAGFTTIELKTNFVGTARDGVILCRASAMHIGRSTQVWDATVTAENSGRTIAVFRCTQMILREPD